MTFAHKAALCGLLLYWGALVVIKGPMRMIWDSVDMLCAVPFLLLFAFVNGSMPGLVLRELKNDATASTEHRVIATASYMHTSYLITMCTSVVMILVRNGIMIWYERPEAEHWSRHLAWQLGLSAALLVGSFDAVVVARYGAEEWAAVQSLLGQVPAILKAAGPKLLQGLWQRIQSVATYDSMRFDKHDMEGKTFRGEENVHARPVNERGQAEKGSVTM
ncbi:hypothetical protein QQS21_009991 [Conoideocrella luteorostrata]|uniref:Uncharacterized protein n=1 Tax=Conoideocrella luteorostrata TaxID=1105319 RepID=A0AAJ0FPU0_9HYPO|nr:hypothetical protein QQS21_009991 [Conoideocrella luteorostrata]